ncbi:glycerol-3-phosphate acyltransferase [Candidatus Contubernalis alkaliaceticus]|uniref:glycerol-3-phosphate acyltransferase n=1 Tax=Candidatus Contubernalis alkaliaceticus TaxID=338645 RepID=UPI001F4C0FE2|nr:glycerol-3-phosphate acyltransferase [Candidatus Contubernalis alkalaceticus]UNC92468.1 glycerol-3-phosphate acyltransferase [Candidatus Contubernalis alkalaceticus]
MKLDTFFFIALISYLIGSFPTQLFLNRIWRGFFKQKDLKLLYPFIYLFDFFKGIAAVFLAMYLIDTHIAMAIAALALTLGHFWSLFYRFRRGPGLAPLLGVLAALTPHVILPLVVIWVLFLIFTRYMAYATIVSTLFLPLIIWKLYGYDLYIVLGVITAAVVVYNQITELEKIAWGLEPKLYEESPRVRFAEYRKKVRSPGRIVRRLLFLITAFIVVSFLFLNMYVYRGFELQTDIVRAGNLKKDYIAITFDDGPDPVYTPQILDILKEQDVKATFFMVGKHVEMYPEVARRIVEEGHEIGNHTYSHKNLLFLSKDKAECEIFKSNRVIEEVTGIKTELFRPPRGLYSHAVREIIDEHNYKLVLWSLSSRDWTEISARQIKEQIVFNVSGGDIILFHDSGSIITRSGGDRKNTVKALPQIIGILQEEGYEFLTVTELMTETD